MKTNLLIDYLTMSFKVRETQCDCFLNWLYRRINFPLSDAIPIHSFLFYSNCLYYNGIRIHFNVDEVCLDCSGKGCRTVEALNPDFDWFQFLYTFHYFITTKDYDSHLYPVHISRMDIALDKVDDKQVTFEKLSWYALQEYFICKSQYYDVNLGNHKHIIYFGSADSDRFLRIYDKKMEQNIDDETLLWLRYEFQLRDDSATSFFLCLCENGGDFTKTYFGMLRDFLRFITEKNDRVHYERKETCKWWLKFLGDGEKIKKLYLPGDEYDLGRATHYFNKQCASTFRTLLEANGGDVSELLNSAMETKLNARQKELLSNLKTKQAVNEDEQAKRDKLFEKAIADNPAPSFTERACRIASKSDEQSYYNEIKQHYIQSALSWADKKAHEVYNEKMALAVQDLPFDKN